MVASRTPNEIRLERLQARHEALTAIVHAAASHNDHRKLFRDIAKALRPVVPFDRLVFVRPTAPTVLKVDAVETLNGPTTIRLGLEMPSSTTTAGLVLAKGVPFVASNLIEVARYPTCHRLFRTDRVNSCYIAPLIVHSKPLGVLSFLSKSRHAYDTDPPMSLQEASEVVAVGLDDCIVHESLSRSASAGDEDDPTSAGSPGATLEATLRLHPRLSKLHNFVNQSLSERITLDRAARIVGLERTYFSKYFRRATGVCFRDWLTYRRVQRAKKLLTNDGALITRIGLDVGFGSLRTLERAFRRFENCSPLEFRSRHQSGQAIGSPGPPNGIADQ